MYVQFTRLIIQYITRATKLPIFVPGSHIVLLVHVVLLYINIQKENGEKALCTSPTMIKHIVHSDKVIGSGVFIFFQGKGCAR